MQATTRCFGCGAIVPDIHGPTHRYMLSAPGCWQVHGEMTARFPPSQFGVDAYAVQHPGEPGPQANQSVCVHLMNLCRVLENGGDVAAGPAFLQVLTHRDYPRLIAPSTGYRLTIVDLAAAADGEAYRRPEKAFAPSHVGCLVRPPSQGPALDRRP